MPVGEVESLKTASEIQVMFNISRTALVDMRNRGLPSVKYGAGTKRPRYRYFVSKVKEFLEKENLKKEDNEENH